MSYNQFEKSVDRGQPVNLYEFVYGDRAEDVYRFASTATYDNQPFEAAGQQWEPTQIRHGDITNSGNLDRTPLDLTMSVKSKVADLYKISPPSQVVRLRIWRGHITDGDFKLVWSGRVLDGGFEGPELQLNCESLASSLRRIGLRRFYQYGCSHVLYGPECRAPREPNTASGEIVEVIDQFHIVVRVDQPGRPLTTGDMAGGVVRTSRADGQRVLRTVSSAEEREAGRFLIRMMAAVPNMQVGISVDVSRGCAHNFDVCRDRFNNTPNFGGFPNIPTKNPFTHNSF